MSLSINSKYLIYIDSSHISCRPIFVRQSALLGNYIYKN